MSAAEPTLKDLQRLHLEAQTQHLRLQSLKLADQLDEIVASQDRAHVYAFADDVTVESCAEAVATLGEWARLDPETPIEFVFTSGGGYLLPGLGLYDFVRDLVRRGVEIETRALGEACSMAGIMLQAGSTRSISPNSWLMIHEVSSGMWGKVSEQNEHAGQNKRYWRQCLRILASRSTLSAAEIQERCIKRDWYLSAREARRFGFVDVIR